MPVKERVGRARHGASMCGWHTKLYSGVPLLVIASCFILSVLLQGRLIPSEFVVREDGSRVIVVHSGSSANLVRDGRSADDAEQIVDDASLLKEDFTAARAEEFEAMRVSELERIKAEAEEEEFQERSEQNRRSWEEVNRIVRKSDKEELHERDDGELERSGQPLCIYEIYSGQSAWPYLHQSKPLYRGLSLSTKGRRPGGDDVDASLRLPSLNESYYLDLLCDYAGLFAIAHRIDRVHKNDWIGFQPWRAAGRKVALSEAAEIKLIERLTDGVDGDTVYFWAEAGTEHRPSEQREHYDYWKLCDSVNAGNCRSMFLAGLKQMYGLPESWTKLPSMISDSSKWAGMHCWVMPTSSFVELVMFVRMFVDALDEIYHTAHHDLGECQLGVMKARHCYCNMLEGLVNVWAYHSARKLIYVNPQTGVMQEVHEMKWRQGLMWVQWFNLTTLKAMDEDLAEFADVNGTSRNWLWPKTGEVFWQGMVDRERLGRLQEKMDRKQKNKERIARMRTRYRQKAVGRYVKPQPGVGYV